MDRRTTRLEKLDVRPGSTKEMFLMPNGKERPVPEGWARLLPGDAGLTRRVKAAGPSWTVKVKKGRREFSQGVWAPARIIKAERERLVAERSTEAYARRRQSDARRREKQQEEYVGDFHRAILDFLDFAPLHRPRAEAIAEAVAAHATPVGSGTVARTRTIPIERRAEAAVIAWMRHRTTAYDDLVIPRVRGKRREVRRQLAALSRELLTSYRRGDPESSHCPLARALQSLEGSGRPENPRE